MVEGRSKQTFKQWLADRRRSWRDDVKVVAMDGFTGYADLGVMPIVGSACLVRGVRGPGSSA